MNSDMRSACIDSVGGLGTHALAILVAVLTSRPLLGSQACGTERVNLGPGFAQLPLQSFGGGMTSDGAWILFDTDSSFLVPQDPFGQRDVFVRNRLSGTIELITYDSTGQSAGGKANDISADGRWVVFESTNPSYLHGFGGVHAALWLRDRQTGAVDLISVGWTGAPPDGFSGMGRVSDDGRIVAFMSTASNLVPGDTNGHADVFIRDRQLGVTQRVSISSAGLEADGFSTEPEISGDGSVVVFRGFAANLVPGDVNGSFGDVFVRDLSQATTEIASLTSTGVQAQHGAVVGAVSADGRYIVFDSGSPDVVPEDPVSDVDTFVRDRAANATSWVSSGASGIGVGFGSSEITADGRFVAFRRDTDTTLPDTDNHTSLNVFVHDRLSGATAIASVSFDGSHFGLAEDDCDLSGISADGRVVAFDSEAPNLVSGDTNGFRDDFVRDCHDDPPDTYCTGKVNSQGCLSQISFLGYPSVNASGGFLVRASNLLNNVNGLLFWGTSGAASTPFQGGFLCVASPVTRTSLSNSGGSRPPVQDCTGVLEFDFNTYLDQGGAPPELQAGVDVWCQYWSRDPQLPPPDNTNLTDALQFRIGY